MKRHHSYLNPSTGSLSPFSVSQARETLSRKWCAVCSKSAFRGNALGSENHAPTSFLFHGHGERFLSAHVSRSPYTHPSSTRCASVLSLYGYFYLFLRGAKRTVRYYRPRNGAAAVWRGERKRTTQRKIFMATRSIKLRRIYTPDGWFCQTLSFLLNQRVLLLPANKSEGTPGPLHCIEDYRLKTMISGCGDFHRVL